MSCFEITSGRICFGLTPACEFENLTRSPMEQSFLRLRGELKFDGGQMIFTVFASICLCYLLQHPRCRTFSNPVQDWNLGWSCA